MGWWSEDTQSEQLLQGDEPYDIAVKAFEEISASYQREWKRKPTLKEVLRTIEVVLKVGAGEYLSGQEDLELVGLTAKTKKRRRRQPYHVGDFFAIPRPGGLYAFGRILSDLGARLMGPLIGIYDTTSHHPLRPEQLRGGRFMFDPFYHGCEACETGRWRILGNLPVRPDEFTYPKFRLGHPALGWQIEEGGKVRDATEEEVQGLDFARVWPAGKVEARIMRRLEGLMGALETH